MMDLLKLTLLKKVMTSQKLFDVIAFFKNENLYKFILQILLLNVLYPLALVSTEKLQSCVSFKGFVF